MSPKVVRKLPHNRSKPYGFWYSMSLLLKTSDLSSEDEGDYEEDEEIYDAQEAFNDLFQ